MNNFNITHALLFRAGVGWFTAEGQIEGDTIYFPVPQDQVDDFLKTSLVSFQDNKVALKNLSFELDATDRSLFSVSQVTEGLIKFLNASEVEIRHQTDDKEKSIQGKVLGYQYLQDGKDRTLTITVVDDDYEIKSIQAPQITSINLLDENKREKLEEYLSAASTDDDKKQTIVKIQLSKETKQVKIHFVSEIPAWKLSYRLLISENEAILETYGIVDNTTLVDFINCKLTLSTTIPVSFKYDLSTPHTINRPSIERQKDMNINTPEPKAKPQMAEPVEATIGAEDAAVSRLRGLRKAGDEKQPKRQIQTQATTTSDAGAAVEFKLDNPVSVKKNESSVVPLTQTELDIQKKHYFNENNHKIHPFEVIEFVNPLDYAIDKGPLSVIHEGTQLEYRGEAMLSRIAEGESGLITYALDRNITVTRKKQHSSQLIDISIKNAFHYSNYDNYITYKFSIHNRSKEKITMYLAIDKDEYEPAPSMEENRYSEVVDEYRVLATVSPQSKDEVEFKMVKRTREQKYLSRFSVEELEEILEDTSLSEKEEELVKTVLKLEKQINNLQQRKQELQTKIDRSNSRREQIVSTLEVLEKGAAEEEVRRKYVDEIQELDDSLQKYVSDLEEVEKEISQLRQDQENPHQIIQKQK